MGVYIKNMEMPGSCFVCPVSHPAYYRTIGCGITGKTISAPECEEKRMESCPLISVPPHGRLIDADELMKRKIATLTGWGNTTWTIDSVSCTEIKNAPTIIEAEGDSNEGRNN